MRVEQGYAVMTDRLTGKMLKEETVFSCAHCSRKVHAETLHSHHYSTCYNCEDGRGRGLICDRPKCNTECTPFMRKLEAAEAIARFRSML